MGITTFGGVVIPISVIRTGDKNAVRKLKQELNTLNGVVSRVNKGADKQLGLFSALPPSVVRLNRTLNSLRWTMVNVGFAMTFIAGIAMPFVALAKAGIEWELQLKRIQIVTEGVFKSTAELSNLSDFLLKSRKGTPFTRQETSEAFLEFTKAGFTAGESFEVLPDILTLATAGFTDLDTATNIMVTSLNAFAVQGLESAEALNVIALAANESALDVSTFGSAMSFVAPVAASAGFSFKETAAALSLLSNAGLKGSKAGTTLRQVINSIVDPSEEAKKTMRGLGIEFFDAEGNIKSLSEIMHNLSAALDGLTLQARQQAIGELFNIRGGTGTRAFLNFLEEGSSSIAVITERLNDMNFANEAAASAMETSAFQLKDAWNNLKDSFIPAADAMRDSTTGIIIGLTNMIERMREANKEGDRLQIMNVRGSPGVKFLKNLFPSENPFAQFVGPQFTPADLSIVDEESLRKLEQQQRLEQQELVLLASRRGFLEDISDLVQKMRGKLAPPETKPFDSFITQLQTLQERISIDSITKAESTEIGRLTTSLQSNRQRIVELVFERDRWQTSIKNIRKELTVERAELSRLNTSLSEATKRISELSRARFKGETDTLAVLRKAEIFRKKQELAALGVGDAQKFILDALKLEGSEYDKLFEQLSKVNSEFERNQNAFDAWQETIKTAIRAEVEAGQDLGADVTDRIRQWQTALLGIQAGQFGGAGDTQLDDFVNKLQLAYDIHFGGMKDEVTNFLEGQQDREIGVFETSNALISALQKEISTRDELRSAVKTQTEIVTAKFDQLQKSITSLDGVMEILTRKEESIFFTVNAIEKLGTVVADAIKKIEKESSPIDTARNRTGRFGTGHTVRDSGIPEGPASFLEPNFTPIGGGAIHVPPPNVSIQEVKIDKVEDFASFENEIMSRAVNASFLDNRG